MITSRNRFINTNYNQKLPYARISYSGKIDIAKKKNIKTKNIKTNHMKRFILILASYGEYVPKAFFIIDEDGNASPAQPINEVRKKFKTLLCMQINYEIFYKLILVF